MIRCVQGHTDDIAKCIVRADAYGVPHDIPVLVHYTAQDFLPTIIGPDAMGRGLVPGGLDQRRNRGRRPDVYMSTSLPDVNGVLPDRFAKAGTNVAIRIDAQMLQADGADLAVTAAGVVLCPSSITPDYIKLVELFGITKVHHIPPPHPETNGGRTAAVLRLSVVR